MRRSKRSYLFCEGDLSAVLRRHALQLSELVDGIPEGKLRSLTDAHLVREITTELAIEPIELDEAKRVMTREEIKVDVRGDFRRVSSANRHSVLIPGLRVTITTPFQGDPGLWSLRPNSWRSTFPQGVIRSSSEGKGGVLEIALEQPSDDSPEVLKHAFERTMEDVHFYLQSQRMQLDSANGSIPTQVRAAIEKRRERLARHGNLSDLLGIPLSSAAPSKVTENSKPQVRHPKTRSEVPQDPTVRSDWDLFISHASEDKEMFVRPLAEALLEQGLNIWFDEFTLRIGDSLRRSVDRGLSQCRYGVVVISPAFLEKEWPQKELDGLVAREVDGRKVILPVWHNVDALAVRRFSPMLADRLASSSSKGIAYVVEELLSAM